MPAGRQWFGPVLDLQVSEAREVAGVGGNEYKSIGVSDRGNLTIHVRRGSAETLQSCSLTAMPGGGNFVVRRNRKGCLYDVMQILLKSPPSLALGESTAAIRQFVPNRRCDCAFVSVLIELRDDVRVWFLGYRR